jgi:hypothetical protein
MAKKNFWLEAASLVFILALTGCGSTPSYPTAPDFNSFPNNQLDYFVGEWITSGGWHRIFNADGTGIGREYEGDAVKVEDTFQWRVTSDWISIYYPVTGEQISCPYSFSNNYQTLSFRRARQKGQNDGGYAVISDMTKLR